MKLPLKGKWLAGGFGLAVLLTGFSGFVSYQNAIHLMKSTAKVEETHQMQSDLTDVLAAFVGVESEWRDYLLTQNQAELEQYKTATQILDHELNLLHQKVKNDPIQQQRFITLEFSIARWRSLLDRTIRLAQQNPSARSIPPNLQTQNQQIRSDIQRLIAEMQTRENEALQQWVGQAQINTQHRILIEFLSTILSVIVLFSMSILLYRQMIRSQRAEVERQQLEAQRHILAQEKELSELKLNFFSMVSHEFRTPLSLILGSAQLLLEDDQNWTAQKKYDNLERIQSAARLMNQLLTDTLTLTRAEAGKLEFNPALMDVESFCLNLIEDFRILSEPQHCIQFISSAPCPAVCLDERLLYCILSNLLSNAIKYSPHGGMIEFRLDYEPDEIVFQIQDYGIGIPAEAQQTLYEPFHRAKNVGMIIGTGLGLAVVKSCVDLHEGQIWVDSQIGNGTTFTVRLPHRFAHKPLEP